MSLSIINNEVIMDYKGNTQEASKLNRIIKLEGELDLTIEPNETRIKPISGDPWEDFGYWLEATGFMAYQAMKMREWNDERVAEYAKKFILSCVNDYKVKFYKKV